MGTQLLSGTSFEDDVFESVGTSMNFLLVQVLCGFDSDSFAKMMSAGLPYYLLFVLYQIMSSLTLMNMLIGVLCDVVSTVADVEKEESFTREVELHCRHRQHLGRRQHRDHFPRRVHDGLGRPKDHFQARRTWRGRCGSHRFQSFHFSRD